MHSKSTGPTSRTGYPGNPNVIRYSPIARAAPISSNQQQSPAVGYGDLGGQNLGGQTTPTRINPAGERLVGTLPSDQRSSMSSVSSVPSTAMINASVGLRPDPTSRTRSPPVVVINHHPGAATAPRPPSSSSSSSRAMNGGPRTGFRVNESAHSSFV